MQLIDGKATAAQIKAEIAEEVKQIVESGGKRPHLAAILVGHDGGSETYVRNKVLACEACGFKSTLLRFEDTISEEELLAEVDKLNKDEDVDGFIVQLPLPPPYLRTESHRWPSTSARTWTVSTPSTWEEWLSGLPCYISATPKGILEPAPALPCRDERQEMCHPGPQQHRRQTYGTAYDAKAVWRRHGDRMPQPEPRLEERMP